MIRHFVSVMKLFGLLAGGLSFITVLPLTLLFVMLAIDYWVLSYLFGSSAQHPFYIRIPDVAVGSCALILSWLGYTIGSFQLGVHGICLLHRALEQRHLARFASSLPAF